ncbi:hypothetical protein [Botrimarina mediterranea]|nr:hypothetical protein [Botrimarina mediterranea]
MTSSVARRALRGSAMALALLVAANPASGGDGDVVEIEEHWSLAVGGPDALRTAPQVSMVMSPAGGIDSDFFLLSLNHWSYPGFEPGGVQLQHWNGENWRSSKSASNELPLDTDGETIRWAQRLTLSDCSLTYEVFNAESTTWGNFAAGEALKITTHTELARLNGYLPATSLTESGIGYAGNRVSSLVLEKLRWRFDGDDEYQEMVAPIDIDADLDP